MYVFIYLYTAWPFQGTPLEDCIRLAHSDGGTRAHRCSGAAWIVEVRRWTGEVMELHVMAISGTYIELPISSFCAEALALEECTLFIRTLLQRMVSTAPGKKKRQPNE